MPKNNFAKVQIKFLGPYQRLAGKWHDVKNYKCPVKTVKYGITVMHQYEF